MVKSRPDVPHAKVAEIAAGVHQLLELKAKQAATQAQLIRWCLRALARTPTPWDGINERREIKHDKEKALDALAWLADKLDGKDVPDLPTT